MKPAFWPIEDVIICMFEMLPSKVGVCFSVLILHTRPHLSNTKVHST